MQFPRLSVFHAPNRNGLSKATCHVSHFSEMKERAKAGGPRVETMITSVAQKETPEHLIRWKDYVACSRRPSKLRRVQPFLSVLSR